MTSSNDGVPVVLLHHLKHNKVLHEQVILHVGRDARGARGAARRSASTVEKLEHGFYRVTAHYGFMESPNVPEILQWARESGIKAQAERHDVLPRPRADHHLRRRAQAGHAPRAGRRRAPAHGALAQEAVRRHVAQRALGDGVLRDSAEPRRRARSAGRVLSGSRGAELQARPECYAGCGRHLDVADEPVRAHSAAPSLPIDPTAEPPERAPKRSSRCRRCAPSSSARRTSSPISRAVDRRAMNRPSAES